MSHCLFMKGITMNAKKKPIKSLIKCSNSQRPLEVLPGNWGGGVRPVAGNPYPISDQNM